MGKAPNGRDAGLDKRRHLPAVGDLADAPSLADVRARYGRPAVVEAARAVIARARAGLAASESASASPEDVCRELYASVRPRLRPVINATGVVLHTNLGRAPLASTARDAVLGAAGYTNLELRLATGTRGGRDDGVDEHLQQLTGCERAFAVNNGAAAALLTLAATASGREVIVSRGELVEIGGGFRVPEVLAQSGCRLVEVGTTNRTRLADYSAAISSSTGALLKVHRSNFRISGFTEEVGLEAMATLAHGAGLPALYDQGTGDPPLLQAAIRAGIDVVTSSGDKLLGGPQAGLILGRATWVDRLQRHPLARALRIDKLTLAALEATLALWRTGRSAEIPAVAMLNELPSQVRMRAEALARLLGDIPCRVVSAASAAGGGTRPDEPIESFGIRLEPPNPLQLISLLRAGDPPVIARIFEDAPLLDLRTVDETQIEALATAIRQATRELAARPGLDEVTLSESSAEADDTGH